jgi:hypothetical protein
MTVRFDTLSFARRLTEAGEKKEVAEAHALALKEFLMDNLATRDDLLLTKEELSREMTDGHASLRREIIEVRDTLRREIIEVRDTLRREIADVRDKLGKEITDVRDNLSREITDVRKDLVTLREDMRKDIDVMGLKLTVHMGGMLVVAVGALATLSKLF